MYLVLHSTIYNFVLLVKHITSAKKSSYVGNPEQVTAPATFNSLG